MAFKLTYSDGQESQYDDDTVWEVESGVLKLGRKEGQWSVLLSPSHWAVLEVGGASSDGDGKKGKEDEDDDDGDAKSKTDESKDKDVKSKDDEKDDTKDSDKSKDDD